MIRKLILLAVSVSMLSACAGFGGGNNDKMDEVYDEMSRMQQTIADLQASVDELSVKNEALAAEVAQNADSVVELQAESSYMRNEMMVKGSTKSSPAAATSASGTAATATTADNGTAEAQKSTPKIVIIEDVQTMRDSLYSYAYELYRQGKYTESISKFQEFIDKMPNDDLADNSQYWIGENYYSMRDYNKALDAFNKVLTKYPKGGKVPDAMLKVGYSHHELGQKKQATDALNKLIQQYPRSNSANLAKQSLAKWK